MYMYNMIASVSKTEEEEGREAEAAPATTPVSDEAAQRLSGGDPSSGVTNSASEAAEAGKENSAPKKDAATSESPSSSTSQPAEQYVS